MSEITERNEAIFSGSHIVNFEKGPLFGPESKFTPRAGANREKAMFATLAVLVRSHFGRVFPPSHKKADRYENKGAKN